MYNLCKYALRLWERIQFDRIRRGKDKICSWPRMKKMIAINFYSMDCDEILSYTKKEKKKKTKKKDYYWSRSSHLNYFKEPYIPPLRGELYVEENTFLEEYVEVKEENIKIFEEINEGLVIEEEPKI